MDEDDLDAGADIADAAGITEDTEPSTAPAQGDELRGDIEEAIAKQKIERGDPEPYKGLRGRNDDSAGGMYEGVSEFAKLAAKNGTSLASAVRDYHAVETAIRRDPVSGMKYACQRLGLNPVALAQRILQSQQPQTQQSYQQQQYQAQQNYQAQARYHQEYQHHNTDIEAGRRSLPFFDNLRPAMVAIAKAGHARTVRQAYDMALKYNPSYAMSAEIARRDGIRDRQMGRGKRR